MPRSSSRSTLIMDTSPSWPPTKGVRSRGGGGGPGTLLENKSCQCYHLHVLDIKVIDDRGGARVALEPMRSRLLSELAAPASAATLATRVGVARQKVNYHLHALEAHGLVRLAEERKWGGPTERLVVGTAASYGGSASRLGPVALGPNPEGEPLSATHPL